MRTTRRLARTWLEYIPSLRIGRGADRNAYWVITSIVAFTLLGSVLVDIVLHWNVRESDPMLFWVSVAPIVPGTLFVIAPWIFKTKFPRAAGSVGFYIAITVACHNIAISDNRILEVTSLHILPICSLYISWFWKRKWAILHYSIATTFIIVSLLLSDRIGEGTSIQLSTGVFGVLLSLFAFTLGTALRHRLLRKALTDQLTRVWNTRGIKQRLSIELDRTTKTGESLTVAFCDFDNFKVLNDSRGQAYGDRVLKNNLRIWSEAVRPYDVIGRLGGDEFVMLFPKTTKDQANLILTRLREQSTHPWSWGATEVEDSDTVDSLLERADGALYDHKHIRAASAGRPSLADDTGLVELTPKTPRFYSRFQRYQSEFSLMSALVGFIATAGVFAAIIGRDFRAGGSHSLAEGWMVLILASLTVIVPLLLGWKYPRAAGMTVAIALLAFYSYQSFTASSLDYGIVTMFALSLVALYLGTFFGSLSARLVLLGGMIVVIVPILVIAYEQPDVAEQAVMTATALYSVMMCQMLFELGAYLYRRSRMNALRDELTGALNRHGLNEYGISDVSRARRLGHPLSVVMLDCIGFKRINDTYGHAAGDRVLRELVVYLIENVNPYDLVVRVGGDEFVVLLPYRTALEAEALMQTIAPGSPTPIRFGAAQLQPGEKLDALIARADEISRATVASQARLNADSHERN